MKADVLRLLGPVFVMSLSATGMASDLPPPELIRSHGESYVNLQLCSNTYLEYRDRPQLAKRFLDASLKIQQVYTSDAELDVFINAIQSAHDQQGNIEVFEDEGRAEFYRRVFNETRCQQELKTAGAYQ